MKNASNEGRQLSAAYFLYFIAAGLYLPYFPSYLNSRGLTGATIGWILALAPLMRTIVPPLLGGISDRYLGTKFWSMLMAAISAIGMILLAISEDITLFALGLIIYFISTAPAIPLLDAAVVQYLAQAKGRFGHIRLWGSVGFVLTSTGLGLCFPKLPPQVIIGSLICAQLFFAVFIIKAKFSGAPPQRPDLRALPQLLYNRELILLLLALFFNRVASAPYNGFYTLFVQESGHSGSIVAMTWGIAVTVEVVVMLLVDRFIDRFHFNSILAFGVLLEAVRWLAYSHLNSQWALLALAPCHGIAFATLYVASVRGLAQIVPDNMRALGQGLGSAATGLGQMLGLIGAGYIHQLFGGEIMFLIAGFFGLISFVLAKKPEKWPVASGGWRVKEIRN